MKMKRIIALALALCMFGSSLLAGTSNEVTYAYETEQAINELRNVNSQNKADASTQEETENILLLDEEDIKVEAETEENVELPDNVLSPEDMQTEAPANDAETTGVQKGEEVADVATKPEGDATTAGDVEVVEGTTTEIDVKVEEVETDVDLTSGALENNLLNEETVSEDDMVDVIILFDKDAIIDEDPDAEMDFFTKIKVAFMEIVQNATISKIEKKALKGTSLEIDYQYTWLVNGIATSVPYGVIDEIEAIKGVKDVVLQVVYEVSDVEVANPHTIADGGMIGREDTWASGYTGEGVKIAILDTGIDDNHQNFQPMDDEKLTANSATKDTISTVIGNLNASAQYNGLTADDVYLSNKIAFAFNYTDSNLFIDHEHDAQGDHGTHVAGIAAANKAEGSDVVGVAPDAQLYVMKVFGASHGGAAAGDLLAALEDAMILGADVINMSLGSPAGFTSDGEVYDEIYGKISETGVVLAISAGNSDTSAQGNLWGTDMNLTSNPDNAAVSSPGTYVNATTVASVENVAYNTLYLEVAGIKVPYYEGTGEGIFNESVLTIAGEELELVYVPNAGQTAEDFAGVDCAGKVVLVQRGVTAFYEKCDLAEAAGAIACVVYNNEPGAFGMNLEGGTAVIPCISISMEAGEQLLAVLEENPEATVFFSEEEELVASDVAYQMSSFTSWGVSPDLKLEPDITAPGGMIYSTTDDGTYGIMSGTSMSSPNVAGLAALLKQYVNETHPELTKAEVRTFINALLMSTATILETNGVAYSPRVQGAGLANAYLGINTNAYLTVDGMDMPKVELLDDPAKTGNYDYSFNVVNFGDKTIYYHVDTTTQTEGVDATGYFMSSVPVALDAATSESSDAMVLTYDYNADKKANVVDAYNLFVNVAKNNEIDGAEYFRYNVDNDEDLDKADVQAYLNALVGKTEDVALNDKVLKVEAGKTAKVNVNVTLTEEDKAYMEYYFENGIYVEGFTTLTAESASDVDLSLPYMGFYGDWTQAPIIDNGYFWESQEETMASQYVNILWTQYAGELSVWYPGLNPYFVFNEPYDINNVAFSPNGDGYADYLDDIYLSLLRNAAELSFTYTTEDGEVVFEEVIENARKSVWMDAYGMVVPYVYTWYSMPYDFTDANGELLADGTKLTLTISTKLDYDVHESNNLYDTWEIPMTIDLSAPEILDAKIEQVTDETTGATRYYLNMKFADNHKTAAVNFLSKSGTVVLAQYPVDHTKPEGSEYVTYDVTGYGDEFMVVLGDYAFNEAGFYIEAEGNDPILDEDLLYGYRVYDAEIYDDSLYGWLSINKETAATQVLDSEYYMDYALVAAEYVGGYILAVDANKDLVAIKPGYWDERTVIAHIGSEVRDMAFDTTTKTLYAIYKDNYNLASIDIVTGEVTEIGDVYSLSNAIALTCDDNGQLYVLNTSGQLMMLDKETGAYIDDVLLETKDVTGLAPRYAQSMTYDSEKDCIYWACYYNDYYAGVYGLLVKIDVHAETPSMEIIGQIAGGAEVVGLLSLDNKGFELPLDEKLQSIEVEQKQISLLVGGTETLGLTLDPWYGLRGETTFTSANPEVAVVNERGVVTATGVGETTITVSVVVDAETTVKAITTVKVVNPNAVVNGYVLASMNGNLYNQWTTVNTGNMSYTPNTEFSFNVLTAGEYVNGTIYAYGQDTAFYKVDAKTYETTMINGAQPGYQVVDMSYDYSTGYMYGLVQDMNYGTTYLAYIDMLTGEFMLLGELWDEYDQAMCALAVSTNGTIYVLSYTGFLHIVNIVEEDMLDDGIITYCELTSLGYVGYSSSQMLQTMAYDHNAETPGLYWAMCGNAFDMMYIDLETVTALDLGNFDGGVQMTSMYIVPETVPALPNVPVESLTQTAASVTVLTGGTAVMPVQVLPFNATNRNVEWTVLDETVAKIENGIVTGVGAGTTSAIGRIGEMEVQITIDVIEATGDLRGYMVMDIYTGDSGFWISVNDADLSTGTAITDYAEYLLYAGAYYDGYLYGYGVDMNTYNSVYVIAEEVEGAVLENGEALYRTVKMIPGEYPDVVDMAFDYTEGVMYAVAGTRNVYGPNSLYCVDITTGELYKVGDMSDQIMTLACTADGTLYGISMEGVLYEIDRRTAENTELGQLGVLANQYQSMTYDYNTGNIYWAQCANDPMTWATTADLYILDPKATDGNFLFKLGHIGLGGVEVSALHTIPREEIEVGTAEVTGLVMGSTNELLKPGATLTLSVNALPVSVNKGDAAYTYTSSNTAVATVDANGVVTAVAAGKAVITVETNGVTATCTVNVVDDNTTVQVMANDGWQVSPLLNPTVINETVKLPAECGLDMSMVTYADGWYYALDRANAYSEEEAEYQTVDYSRGYLWRFNADLSKVEKVSEAAVYTTFTNVGTSTNVGGEEPVLTADAVLDMFTNPFTNEVYVLGRIIEDWGWGEYYMYHLYKLDTETGATTHVGEVGMDIASPQKVEFISKDTMVVWDHYNDYVYKLSATECDDEGYLKYSQLVWAQNVLASNYKMAMAYNEALDVVFVATEDTWIEEGVMGLYILDPNKKTIKKYSNAKYDVDMIDLVFVQ